MKYIIVIDEGTSSTRATVFDTDGNRVHYAQKLIENLYPKPGWFECDANELWLSTKEVIQKAVEESGISTEDIISVGMTAQRESAIVWDRETGEPVYNCIVWLDRRTDEYCEKLNKNPLNLLKLHMKTGLIITSFFPAVKVEWMLDNLPGLRDRANNGQLCFGTVDTWLIYNMTGKQTFVAEQSGASRTQLFNINTLQWDDDMFKMFNIPRCMVAENVLPSDSVFGDMVDVFDRPIPIAGVLGDQQSATFGQQCFEEGQGKISLGTAGLMCLNVGHRHKSSFKLLSTIGWNVKGKVSYNYEMGFYFCGGLMDWLKSMNFVAETPDTAEMARSVPDTHGIKFVSTFYGMSAPKVLDSARGAIFGLSAGITPAHIVRAALESIAYQSKDTYDIMRKEVKKAKIKMGITRLSADGGVANNDFVMQSMADMMGKCIDRSECKEATSLGALYMSGLAMGVWADFDALKRLHHVEKVFQPQISGKERTERENSWDAAVRGSIVWAEDKMK
ncbi:MAG: glycerol kinase GlpK [Oscillospiraceae bacterium]